MLALRGIPIQSYKKYVSSKITSKEKLNYY